MTESVPTQENIAYIRTHVDRVEQLTRFSIAANKGCAAFVADYLKQRSGASEVYLCLGDDPMSLDEIMKKTKQSKPNASKICSHLANHGMISKIPDPDNKKSFKYCWTDLEAMLGVSKIAKQIIKERKAIS